MHTRPVWAEISRRKLTENYLELRRTLRRAEVQTARAEAAMLAVVKADAYGHGMRDCATVLAAAGAEWLGVTSVEEGVAARGLCPTAIGQETRILIMSGIWHDEANAVIEHRLTSLVGERYHLDLLEKAASLRGLGPASIPVHLEVDTGMSRQGVSLHDGQLEALLKRFTADSALRLEGIATHFSAAEDLESDDTARQRALLKSALAIVARVGHRPRWLHAGNSATLIDRGQVATLQEMANETGARLMLRPGLALYGYSPRFAGSASTAPPLPALSPVLTWKTRITSLRAIAPGERAGYNGTFRAVRPTRLALLPAGYADGLSRQLSNRGRALVRGQSAPIAGRVSMDQTIIDVTEVDSVEIGDEAVLLGAQGEASITAEDHAELTGTIPYEVLCRIAARVPRLLVD